MVSVVGADGLPPTKTAGNVLRPSTTLKLSIRLPPTLDAKKALEDCKSILESNPPYGCKVSVTNTVGMPGWSAPFCSEEVLSSFENASNTFYGKPGV